MLIVETIAKIRLAYFTKGKSFKQICRELRASRNTVRKVVCSGVTEFSYDHTNQPRQKNNPWCRELNDFLTGNGRWPKWMRLSLIRVYDELRNLG